VQGRLHATADVMRAGHRPCRGRQPRARTPVCRRKCVRRPV